MLDILGEVRHAPPMSPLMRDLVRKLQGEDSLWPAIRRPEFMRIDWRRLDLTALSLEASVHFRLRDDDYVGIDYQEVSAYFGRDVELFDFKKIDIVPAWLYEKIAKIVAEAKRKAAVLS